ncbi:DNA end-binding protein Ku [Streptomyces sp. PvR006]|uniref:Ku protein n=1 Tax=Streptomyces sp. PvR006 TaxID=2817860 RepID=UPI001AE2C6AD|nr:Ku protein [Streptomyces sp. PvR006]MBP2579618.1 DNA end-binding protein Ku [Streptomyces sp. PvR006]
MPRVMWSGAISFGPAAVPITLEPTTGSHGMHFRQVHLEHGGRVRYQKRCVIDGQALTEDDPVAFDAYDYYARPEGDVAAQPYTLLGQALSRTDKVAVVNDTLRGHARPGLLRPVGEALSIQGLHWDDEISSPPELARPELAPPGTDVGRRKIAGALTLRETMTVASLTDLDVIDHYTEAHHEVIEAKAEHRASRHAEGEDKGAALVVDRTAALEQSVADARERRGETGEGGEATVHTTPKPNKKGAAKKAAPARKTAAKKTTAARRRKSG